jgi:tetrahydromethanopterin S-methyltransferase subunit G
VANSSVRGKQEKNRCRQYYYKLTFEKIIPMDEKVFNLLEKMYLELTGKIDGISTELQEVKTEVKQNSNHILRLEYKVENKFGALFDARETTNEKLDTIDTKVDNVASDLSIIKMITTKNI